MPDIEGQHKHTNRLINRDESISTAARAQSRKLAPLGKGGAAKGGGRR